MDSLPDDLLVQILSFLPTKEAASTSLLSKRWRTLFALSPNLHFDNSILLHYKRLFGHDDIQKSFNDFVDHTLALHGCNTIKKLSIKLMRYTSKYNQHDVDRWICNALEHGVSELHLVITTLRLECPIPSKVFTSTTLVKLSLGPCLIRLPSDAYLPALKVLRFESYTYWDCKLLNEFLAACPVLEDLTTLYEKSYEDCHIISSKSIKKLSVTIESSSLANRSCIIMLDTPSVVDLYYSDYLGIESPQFHLDSHAKATLDLHLLQDYKQVNVTDLINGICNVKSLHLTSSTVEVISVCYKDELPMFNNLVDLVFSSEKQSWRVLLPLLLQHSPNLKTLVLSGLDGFTCKRRWFTRIPSNNQIKMLSIMKCHGKPSEVKHIRHFLLKMEFLEVLKVYVAAEMDDPKKMQLKEDLLKLPTASSKLKIQ
ncbi:hypothetical protein CARUB_v10019079mg, partial [Capsella rubella]